MKTKKIKGVITIFLCIIFAAFLGCFLILTDAVRINECAEMTSEAIALSALAIDSSYNKEIYKDLDLVLYTMNDDELLKIMGDTLNQNLYNTKQIGLVMTPNIWIFQRSCPADSWYWGMGRLALKYVNSFAGEKTINNKFTCSADTEYDREANEYVARVVSGKDNYKKIEELLDGNNLFGLFYDYLPDMGKIDDDKYEKRYSVITLSYDNLEKDDQDRYREIDESKDVYDELKNASLYGGFAERKEEVFRLSNDGLYYYPDECEVRYDALNIFMRDHFKDALAKECGKSGLYGEREYLLYGYPTDRENVAKVLGEMLKLRLYMNLKALYYEGADKHDDEEAVFISFKESWHDVWVLYNGGSIPWEKKANEFITNVKDSLEKIASRAVDSKYTDEKSGLTYEDYLTGQTYISCYSGHIICGETVNAKFFDLLYFRYGVDAKQINDEITFGAEYTCDEEYRKKMLSTLGELMITNKKYTRFFSVTGG